VFADSEYLSHWSAPDALGEGAGLEQPVTRVSWFAARAYCKASGARLPDWYEWELAATAPNRYGVHNLNGAIWEWVEDFNSLMASGDSRTQGDPDKLRFCGAGALSAQDRENYPTLMRIAFLSALEARSTERSLGFRCAVQPLAEAPSERYADSSVSLPGDSLFRLDIKLETADGHTLPLSALRGRPLLLTLFYSECSSVCPMTTAQLQTIVHKLLPSARKNITALMVSLDAARDTPTTLTNFVQQHHLQGPTWIVARASASDVRTLAAALGVRYRELPDHTFNHSTVITLADPDGVIQAHAEGWQTVDESFLDRLRAVASSPAANRRGGG
jgi:cytochrome oxidase Cu insertion factor (SCO1/SenC/PrrC family)